MMLEAARPSLFAFSGRRSRKSYAFASLILIVAILITSMVAVWGLMTGNIVVVVIVGLCSVPLFVSAIAVTSQRCRDFGWTGWAMVLSFVPYVGWIFGLAIAFIPGSVGPNRYGLDPQGR